jgi:hypothetical protein
LALDVEQGSEAFERKLADTCSTIVKLWLRTLPDITA